MPIYVFEDSQGAQREEFYPVHEAPRIGDAVTLEGRSWTRVPVVGSVMGRREVHFTSQAIQPFHPDAPRHDAEGLAQFHSRKEVEEFGKKAGMKYDEL